MRCEKCGTDNPDNANFCLRCGERISITSLNQNEPQPDNLDASVEKAELFSKTMPIVSLVLNFVIFNVIGLIFAVLSLANYSSYETALNEGNIALSTEHESWSKKYAKIAIIIAIVVAVIAVIIRICYALLMFGVFY